MDNEINMNVQPYTPRNSKITYDTGILKLLAEYDYVLGRYLTYLPVNTSNALFHYQQCIEKYLKAYLAFLNDLSFDDLRRQRKGHDLMALLEICARHDIFFADEKLISSCSKLNDFSEVGRYPNDLMQSYGTEYPNSVHFLDEFTYKMRLRFQPRQVGENIADGIHAIFINTSHPLSNNARAISSQLMSAMYLDNPYAERIIQQFPGH